MYRESGQVHLGTPGKIKEKRVEHSKKGFRQAKRRLRKYSIVTPERKDPHYPTVNDSRAESDRGKGEKKRSY